MIKLRAMFTELQGLCECLLSYLIDTLGRPSVIAIDLLMELALCDVDSLIGDNGIGIFLVTLCDPC